MQTEFTNEQFFWISQPAAKILSSQLFVSTIISYWQHNYSLLKHTENNHTSHQVHSRHRFWACLKCEYVAFKGTTGRRWGRWPRVFSVYSVVKYFFNLVKGRFRPGIDNTFASLCDIGIAHCAPLYHADIDTC